MCTGYLRLWVVCFAPIVIYVGAERGAFDGQPYLRVHLSRVTKLVHVRCKGPKANSDCFYYLGIDCPAVAPLLVSKLLGN